MKIRDGFVSNSSSSSFVLTKYDELKESQAYKIRHHVIFGKELGVSYSIPEDAWSIDEDKYTIQGDTSMNNFDMEEFMQKIGIDMKYVKFWHS